MPTRHRSTGRCWQQTGFDLELLQALPPTPQTLIVASKR